MLSPDDRANFDTLARAFANGDSALVEVQRVADGAIVSAICAVGREGELWTITPFATMIEGDPFDLFRPPNPNGGFGTQVDSP